MVTSSKAMSTSQAQDYFEKDNYYMKDGLTENGIWFGKGAESLNLRGNINLKDFKSLLNGINPSTNELIKDKLNTSRAGFDITMSAPKTVSMLALVKGDKDVLNAHREAVKVTMKYVEENFAQNRIYTENGKRIKETTSNLTVAQFEHYTARSQANNCPDPQLHTHNFIFNIIQDSKEKWQSLSNEEIYKHHKKTCGQIYQNELGNRLNKLGYKLEWQNTKGNQTFEIKGIPNEIKENFSKRTKAIDKHLEKLENEKGRKLSKDEIHISKLETRSTKKIQNLEELKNEWNKQINTLGISINSIEQNIMKQEKDKSIINSPEEAIKKAIKFKTENESVFSKHEILVDAMKLSQGTFSLKELDKAFLENKKDIDKLNNEHEIVSVGFSKDNNKTELFSSKEIIKAEHYILNSIKEKEDFSSFNLNDLNIKINEFKDFDKLTRGQAESVKGILLSKENILGIQGDAGTGKTTMLKVLNALANEKIEIKGMSKTGVAVKGMEDESGIKSKTIDSFLKTNINELKSNKKQIWIIDESSMIGTKQLEKILIKAKEVGNTQLVLIGDTKQLKPIEAGDMFKKLQESGMKTFQMNETLRQSNNYTKEVVENIKNKNIEKGIEAIKNNGKLFENDNKDKLIVTLLENTTKDFKEKGVEKIAILASTNKEKVTVNNKIRRELQKNEIIDKNNFKFENLEQKQLSNIEKNIANNYKVGDILISNKMQGDIKQNQELKIIDISKKTNSIKVQYKNGNKIKEKWLDAEKGKNFSVFEKGEISLSIGDKIIFEKNNKNLNISNGELAIVKFINSETKEVTFTNDKKEEFIVNLNDYKNFNYGYAMTTYKSQGISIENVHILADSNSKMNSHNMIYVASSRAKLDIKLYVDNKNKYIEKVFLEQEKNNASNTFNINNYQDNKETIDKEIDSKNSVSLVNSLKDKKQTIQNKINQIKNTKSSIIYDTGGKNGFSISYNHLKEKMELIDNLKRINKIIDKEILNQVDNELKNGNKINPIDITIKMIESQGYNITQHKTNLLIEKYLSNLNKEKILKKDGDSYTLRINKDEFDKLNFQSQKIVNSKNNAINNKNEKSLFERFDKFIEKETNTNMESILKDLNNLYYISLKGHTTFSKDILGLVIEKASMKILAGSIAITGATVNYIAKSITKIAYSMIKNTASSIIKKTELYKSNDNKMSNSKFNSNNSKLTNKIKEIRNKNNSSIKQDKKNINKLSEKLTSIKENISKNTSNQELKTKELSR